MRLRLGGIFGVAAVLLALLAVPAAGAQESALFFPGSGHTLTEEHGFLSYWQGRDGMLLLGAPISEPIGIVDYGVVQYFEKGRLEKFSDPVTGELRVAPGRVALEYVETLFRSFPPMPPRRLAEGDLFFEETRHSIREPFLSFWKLGGEEVFGRPISEALWEPAAQGQRLVQYFERVRLERDPARAGTPDEFIVADLGRSLALLRGIDIAPIANPGYAVYSAAPAPAPTVAPFGAPAPTPAPPPPAPVPAAPAPAAQAAPQAPRTQAPANARGKSIVVNLSSQWLYAYEGEQLVFDAPVATGRDGMNTPTGTFSVYAKLPVQTMDGVTDGEYWVVPNVPSVMYIYGGVALHGTYWHNLFGTGARPSHGCVNLPLRSAAWLYNWAPIGTTVRVTY
jgi:lipoprotein-anchoring transpeptidase ErfK/SrfK